jgi:hypothetical protein
VIDEIWVPSEGKEPEAPPTEGDHAWGQYCFCAQRILWENGERSIRLGYFRRRVGEPHWEFAGQTTITTDPATMKELLEQTLAKGGVVRVDLVVLPRAAHSRTLQ